jgi:hypothetical protein
MDRFGETGRGDVYLADAIDREEVGEKQEKRTEGCPSGTSKRVFAPTFN